MQSGFVESFNGRMREEFLDETLFRNLAHARDLITDRVTARAGSALGRLRARQPGALLHPASAAAIIGPTSCQPS